MKLKEQIAAYLNKPDTDYAIMLSGEWGCGKTYFIENLEKESGRTYIYYSLNGVTKTSEIINSIYLELFSTGKFKGAFEQGRKIASVIGEFIKEKNEMAKLAMNIGSSVADNCFDFVVRKELKEKSNNIVVILDDLERISDSLDITDLLGTIHTKLTLNGVKVIYVSAEDEIKDSDKKKFDKEKEKYIQRTLSFITEKNEVINSFLDDYGINTQDFMENMCKVFDEQQINLRTVKFCLECYNDISVFCKTLPSDEFDTPESLFFTICQIGKFYKKGHTNKELTKQELDSYYVKTYLKNNSDRQQSDYENFAANYGSVLIKESFIFDLIFDGTLSEENIKFYLRKPKVNQDPLYALTYVLDMETSELIENLNKVIQNLKMKKYSIMQYKMLRDNFLPSVKKVNLDTKNLVINMISESIFAEQNKDELEKMFEHWLEDSFSRIKNAENDFEQQLLERFNNYYERIESSKAEDFYQFVINCNRKIYDYKFDYTIFSSLVKRGYIELILSLPNKSVRYFTYFIHSSICCLQNACDFYTDEIPALEKIKTQCDEKQEQIDKADVLKIAAVNNLRRTIESAIKQIEKEYDN